jgi:hypothetical protein
VRAPRFRGVLPGGQILCRVILAKAHGPRFLERTPSVTEKGRRRPKAPRFALEAAGTTRLESAEGGMEMPARSTSSPVIGSLLVKEESSKPADAGLCEPERCPGGSQAPSAAPSWPPDQRECGSLPFGGRPWFRPGARGATGLAGRAPSRDSRVESGSNPGRHRPGDMVFRPVSISLRSIGAGRLGRAISARCRRRTPGWRRTWPARFPAASLPGWCRGLPRPRSRRRAS